MSSVFGALVPPVELVAPDRLGPVHFIAIGGAGMSGIAALYAELGVQVSGSDQAASPALEMLAERGVRVHVGHAADQLGDAGTVVVSSAIAADNPELVAARARGLRIWHRSAALGALMLGRPGIAVGGTHGKTTTSAMVAHLLNGLGEQPGYVVGAPLADGPASALGAPGAPFVVEADESDGSFLQYPAEVAVVTNIEADHLDNWRTPQAYADGFGEFVGRARVAGLNADDPGTIAIFGARADGFGAAPGAGLRIGSVSAAGFGSTAEISLGQDRATLRLQVPGAHNVHNAAAALWSVRATLGERFDLTRACAVLGDFRGTHRRFSPVGEAGGVRVFDDYAHHPTELVATLSAARAGLAGTGGRLIACFQPHLFSRTRDFAAEFGRALALADETVLMEIYPARERAEDFPGVTSELLVEHARAAGGSVRLVTDRAVVPGAVAELARPGDVVLILGAGDVTRIAPEVVTAVEQRR
ncbi:UDP-N-acetylmuramate--L-alanine ligase [Propionibacteriaceae bacterium ES.041]|nr:UDP-N-acetylmuramate--L-alanine ligase [Propionibacteriaceae bacterium ES.041]